MFNLMIQKLFARSFAFIFARAAAITLCGAAVPANAERIKHPVAVFSGLDKITGRTIAFEAAAGETVQFGTLQITERACYTRPATEAPQTTSFIEVDEIGADKKYKRIFSGWMFAASPGLHGIEHPIYDIWLTDCAGGEQLQEGQKPGEPPPPPEYPTIPPDSPLLNSLEPQQAPAESEPSQPPPEHHKGRAGKKRAHPAPQETPQEAPQETIGEPQPSSPPADLGAPIEVGPPPGLPPAPKHNRLPPGN